MNLIIPSFDIWEQGTSSPLEDMWKHIARCTRVCYQSTPKENGETDEEFVKRVILRHKPWNSEANHLAMLEHGTVYLKDISWNHSHLEKYKHNRYSKYTNEYLEREVIEDGNDYDVDYKYAHYVTTNLRVLVENDWLNDLKYICAPTEHHAKRVTVSFTTNIGVSREFNRHRVDSPAEESTRYCNYNKKNNGQLNIGLAAWLINDESLPYIRNHQYDSISEYADEILANEDDELLNTWCDIDFYLSALTFAEWHYNMLIKKGWKPQQAREVLPLATKSQLIHTAFVDDWKHFFALRADGVSGSPHPNAALLAKPLKEEFIKRNII